MSKKLSINEWNSKETGKHLGPIISCLNHSETPNVEHYSVIHMDKKTYLEQCQQIKMDGAAYYVVIAVSDINQGDELFISYRFIGLKNVWGLPPSQGTAEQVNCYHHIYSLLDPFQHLLSNIGQPIDYHLVLLWPAYYPHLSSHKDRLYTQSIV